MKEIHDIITAHLHDEASAEDVKILFDWIQSDSENAKVYARAAMLHAQLREQLSGELQVQKSGAAPVVRLSETGQVPARPGSRRDRTTATLATSVAVCLLLVLVIVLSRNGDQNVPLADTAESSETFATVAQTINAVWGSETNFQSGDRAAATTLDLKSGFVRLRFDSGVEVTLEGPARFELVSKQYSKFYAGLLTSTVPPGAKGFRIDTPKAQVVDLGTSFGIELTNDGAARVSVFEGEVEVGLASNAATQLLTEGNAVLVESGNKIEEIPFDATAYEKIWPVSSGISSSSGAFRFAPPWPRRLRLVRSDSDIFVIPEGYSLTLQKPLDVNVSKPGVYIEEDQLTPDTISTGQSVRSYILHYHPEKARPPQKVERIQGSIVFDQPVLGLILLQEELVASAGRFSFRSAGELHERRQIELRSQPPGDEVTLSADRRTVTLDLVSPKLTSDVLRVIVDAAPQTPAEQN